MERNGLHTTGLRDEDTKRIDSDVKTKKVHVVFLESKAYVYGFESDSWGLTISGGEINKDLIV